MTVKTASMSTTHTFTVKEAKAEILKIIGDLGAIKDRMVAIRDRLPLAPEPTLSLMRIGYMPQDEAECIRVDLDSMVGDGYWSEGFAESELWILQRATKWTKRQREKMFFETRGEKVPRSRTTVEEAIKRGEDGNHRAAEIQLGSALQEIDPDEDTKTFLEVLSRIVQFKWERWEARYQELAADKKRTSDMTDVEKATFVQKAKRVFEGLEGQSSDLQQLRQALEGFEHEERYKWLEDLSKRMEKTVAVMNGARTGGAR